MIVSLPVVGVAGAGVTGAGVVCFGVAVGFGTGVVGSAGAVEVAVGAAAVFFFLRFRGTAGEAGVALTDGVAALSLKYYKYIQQIYYCVLWRLP